MRIERKTKRAIWEGILFIGLLAAGLVIRILDVQYDLMLSVIGEGGAYYDAARVKDGVEIPQVVHGATYIYVFLLRMLFWLVGNNYAAGIWLQIGLQFAACVMMYCALKKADLSFAGVLLTGCIMLMPSEVSRGTTYSPDMLYLCLYGIGLLCVAFYLKKLAEKTFGSFMDMAVMMVSGAWFGVMCYLDITGISLPVIVVVAFTSVGKKSFESVGKAWCGIVLMILAAAAAFVGCFALDGYYCKTWIGNILTAWLEMYRSKGMDLQFLVSSQEWITASVAVSGVVCGIICCILCRSVFWMLPWGAALLVLYLLEAFQVTTGNLYTTGLLFYISVILAGSGIEWIFRRKEALSEEDEFGNLTEAEGGPDTFEDVEMQEGQGVEKDLDVRENQEVVITREPAPQEPVSRMKKVQFIENPLPLPKKHVKKAIEFALEPDESQMHFDIEVDEKDDFDI